MMRSLLVIAILVAGLAGTTTAHAHADPAALSGRNLRIMPLGDSITWGYQSSTGDGYRLDLANQLSGNTVDFVGSQRSGSMADPDNEGHSGAEIATIADYAAPSLREYQPNLVLVLAGTNDVNNNDDPAGAPGRLGSLLDEIFAEDPGTAVVVSTLPVIANASSEARVQTFNQQLPAIVSQRTQQGRHITIADQSDITTADLKDGLHPTDGGYQKMAVNFANAISAANTNGWIGDPVAQNGGHDGLAPCAGTPNWINEGQIASGGGSGTVEFGDITGSGLDDYLLVSSTGATTDFWNAGPGGGGAPVWVNEGQIAAGTGSGNVAFADVSGDGRDDYLVVNSSTGAVSEWHNGGPALGGDPSKPVWVSEGTIATGIAGGTVEFADINGDGRADYLSVNPSTGAVTEYLNAGPPSGGDPAKPVWVNEGVIATGAIASGQTAMLADLNGDRRADYLAVNSSTGAVTEYLNVAPSGGDPAKPVWVNKGQVASGVLTSGTHVAFADLNGDLRADYLTVNSTGAVSAYRNGC